MADTPLRETLLENIKTKLEGIIGGGTDYFYSDTLKSVQRYSHTWDGSEHTANIYGEVPTIIIRVLSESSSTTDVGVGLWLNDIEVDLQFVIRGEDSSDTNVNQALADMKRALFVSYDDFGGLARNVDLVNRLVDPQTGMPIDGIHLTLSIQYDDQLGVPSAGH